MSTKFHQKQWFTWLLLIFFAPVGIFLLWKNKHYGKTANIIISVICVIFFLGIVGSGGDSNNSKVSSDKKTTISTTAKPTTKVSSTPTPTLSAEEKKKQEDAKLKAEAEAKQKEAKADYDEWVNSQFSLWDGSHKELVKLLKKNLNDPDSYEHVETKYWDQKDGILIKMTYRAKNAFGGLILQNITAKADYKTNVVNIISQNN